MKFSLMKTYSYFKNVSVLNLFFWSVLILYILPFLYKHSSKSFILSASFNDLMDWYPDFYFLIFIVVKLTLVLPYVLIGLQMFVVFFSKQVNLAIKVFLLGSFIFTYIYSPDLIWVFSAQCLLVWSYFHYKPLSTNITTEKFTKIDKWLIFLIVIIAFAIRFIWILKTDNSGIGDAGSRLSGMKGWITSFERVGLNNGINNVYFVMPSQDWLPLHYYLVGLVGKITNEWVYSPRVLSAIMGALTIIPLFKLSYLKFNKQTAFISVILFSLYGYHIFLSSLVLSEAFYIFFVVLAYYIIERWVISNSDSKLIYLAFILGCLCLLRYEGWFISLLIVFILPFIKTIVNWRTYFKFSFIVLLSTLFILISEILYGFNPLRGLLYSDYEVKISYLIDPKDSVDILLAFKAAFIPLSLLSFIVIGFTLMKRELIKLTLLWLLYVLPLLPFIYKLANGTLTPQARYITLYMVPLIPFIGFMIVRLYRSIPKWKFMILFSFFLVLFNLPFYQQILNKNLLLRYPVGCHESAKFAKKIEKGQFYLDGEIEWEGYDWQVEAGLTSFYDIKLVNQRFPKQLIHNNDLGKLFDRNVINSVALDKNLWHEWNDTNFNKLLLEGSITHILLLPTGILSEKLNFSNLKEDYLGLNFYKLFEKDGYFIYEVETNSIER